VRSQLGELLLVDLAVLRRQEVGVDEDERATFAAIVPAYRVA
jgi:hypothetical protein